MCSEHGGSLHKSACTRKTDATITLNNTVIFIEVNLNKYISY